LYPGSKSKIRFFGMELHLRRAASYTVAEQKAIAKL